MEENRYSYIKKSYKENPEERLKYLRLLNMVNDIIYDRHQEEFRISQGNKRTIDSPTKRNVIDIAWKANGLGTILRAQGERVDLWDLERAYDIAFEPSSERTLEELNILRVEIEWAYRKLNYLTRVYKHDSGIRK